MMYVADTHVFVWWLESARRLPAAHRRLLARVAPGRPLLLSDVSLWEIAMLHRLGRLRLSFPTKDWLERAAAPPLVELCPITPAVAAESAALPDSFPRDPADRLIAATAIVHGATLLTCDARILEARVVPTI